MFDEFYEEGAVPIVKDGKPCHNEKSTERKISFTGKQSKSGKYNFRNICDISLKEKHLLAEKKRKRSTFQSSYVKMYES